MAEPRGPEHSEGLLASGIDPDIAAFYDAFPHPNVEQPLTGRGKHCVAQRQHRPSGEIVAAAWFRRIGPFAQIGGVLVHPERRGQGDGPAVLARVESAARASGARWAVLGAYRRPPDVSGFYRRCGYRVWIPFIPGTRAFPPSGWLARLLRIEAGPDNIRIMGKRL